DPGARRPSGGLRREQRVAGLERARLAALEPGSGGVAARLVQLRVGREEVRAQRSVAGDLGALEAADQLRLRAVEITLLDRDRGQSARDGRIEIRIAEP